MGCGAGDIAWGCLNLWLPLAPLAMDAFDIGLKATALEWDIKAREKRKDHLFSSLSFFFFKSAEGEQAPWQHRPPQAACWRSQLNHPAPTEQQTPRPSLCLIHHSPVTSITWLAGKSIPKRGSATAASEQSRRQQDGCEEERDPVNKPRLNRLLGAVQAEPH